MTTTFQARRPSGGGVRRPPPVRPAFPPSRAGRRLPTTQSVRPAFPPSRAGRRLPTTNRRLPSTNKRVTSLAVVLLVSFAAVIVRLVDVQIVNADRYSGVGVSQREQTISLPAQRGTVLDRNGAELAVSVPRPTGWADPEHVTDPAGAARALAPILKVDEASLRDKLTASGAFEYLARRVDDATAKAVADLKLDGVYQLDEPTRMSPAGSVASSLLGSVGVDNDGLSGLEKQFDKDLTGTPGARVVERDPTGRDIAGGVRETKTPVRGDNLVLTIDRDLQYVAEQALADQITASNAKAGVAIVSDPRTGEILAMANMVAGAKGQPPQPAGYNKAVIDVYEPGSVNKIVTMSAAVEQGAITPADTLVVPDHITVAGTTFEDAEAHASYVWSPADVIAESSNAGAILIAQKVGKTNLDKYLRAFGLDGDTGLDYPGEASGIVPDLSDWSGTTLPTLAIGYGLAVTPLHMLEAVNTIANGGVYVAPSLVRSEVDPAGKVHDRADPASHRVVSEDTASKVTRMLEQVVTSGTGSAAAVDGYTVAGKTGTARKLQQGTGYQDDAYVASFAGFVPAESPRLSAIVVLDQPQPYYGGVSAAPVFAKLAAYAVRHFQVPAQPPGGLPAPSGSTSSAAQPLAAATLRPSSATRP